MRPNKKLAETQPCLNAAQTFTWTLPQTRLQTLPPNACLKKIFPDPTQTLPKPFPKFWKKYLP